jgi:PIN domain nuclease of toxin-antitoxin system
MTDVLLDTNAVIWWFEDLPQLGQKARQILANPTRGLFVSAVSLWEITIKWRVGKYPRPGSAYAAFLDAEGVNLLAVAPRHVAVLERLEFHHRDPFDHLILAQAKAEGLTLMTSDAEMTRYGVPCVGVR